ncbi:hypothetical protein [Aeromonas jandaei]|uniref:hypothetical protein n=1 Tax=Aeromonas jandaei TaxID=650 RepID=UPI003BA15244
MLYLIPGYVLVTYLMFLLDFFIWPIDFDGVLLLSIFVAGVIIALCSGIGLSRQISVPFEIKSKVSGGFIFKRFIVINILLGLMIFLSISLYTGGGFNDVLSLALDPKLAYERTLSFEVNKDGWFYVYKACSILSAPLYYAVIPLMILQWKNLSNKKKLFGFMFVMMMVIFSIFRGTDREIGEIIILIIGASLVNVSCKIKTKEYTLKKIIKVFLYLLFIFVIFFMVFSFRKYERLSGDIYFCIYDVTCLNKNSFFSDFLWDEIYFSVGMLISYLTQGYYGLYLTMGFDSCFTFFVGHSPFLTSVAEKIFGVEIYKCSLMGQLSNAGWSDSYTWSTIYPWLANDLSYYGVIPFIFLMSIFLSYAWKFATERQLFSGAMVFIFFFYGAIFSVANNQLALAPEIYFSFLTWCFLFLNDMEKRKIK